MRILMALLAGMMWLLSNPALARTAASMPSQAADAFVIGNLHVEVHGNQGSPLILIPGLGSGAWVWQGTVDALQDEHRLFVVTLGGFNGTAPPDRLDGLMKQTLSSMHELIVEHDIHKPVLVGHSIGGTLAIAFAEKHSDLLAGVVAVDGLPVFPTMVTMTAEQREAAAKRAKASIEGLDAAQFRKNQVGYMKRTGVMDAADAVRYGELQARSDPRVVAQYLYEDLRADYRPGLAKISVPLLEIVPWNKSDSQAAAKRGQPSYNKAQTVGFYGYILQGAPQLKVQAITPARHFVMLDQPQKFVQALVDFLEQNGSRQ